MESTDSITEEELRERARTGQRLDVRKELDRLDKMIEDLKVRFEKYFLQLHPYTPDQEHRAVKMLIRQLRKSPFRNSEMKYRLRVLEGRYNTYNNYWQRTLKQKEDGTYSRDVFKASMREQHAFEDERSGTSEGNASRSMQALFNSYKQALQRQTGKSQNLDYQKFRKTLVERAKAFKAQNGNKKMSFKISEKNGKVKVTVRAK